MYNILLNGQTAMINLPHAAVRQGIISLLNNTGCDIVDIKVEKVKSEAELILEEIGLAVNYTKPWIMGRNNRHVILKAVQKSTGIIRYFIVIMQGNKQIVDSYTEEVVNNA